MKLKNTKKLSNLRITYENTYITKNRHHWIHNISNTQILDEVKDVSSPGKNFSLSINIEKVYLVQNILLI